MIKTKLASTLALAITSGVSSNVNAALITDTLLAFNAGYVGCPTGTQCIYPAVQGSYFAFDANADGLFQDAEKALLAPGYDGGIIIGRTQLSGISIPEEPLGAGIDSPWIFNNGIGWHEISNPISVVNDNGLTKDLDFSGWNVNWNGVQSALGINGVATITCETITCADGELFSLDYSILVNDPVNSFAGYTYGLHLEGVVSAVPVPSAIWLFGSGLIGLIGFCKRKKA